MNNPYQQFYTPFKQQQLSYNNNNWNQQMPQQLIRPVSSIEEVKASPIDFDGTVFYFPDVINKRIYTKAVNMDGTVNINLYELKPADQIIDSSYITRQEFEETINKLIQMYESKGKEMSQSAAQPQAFNF